MKKCSSEMHQYELTDPVCIKKDECKDGQNGMKFLLKEYRPFELSPTYMYYRIVTSRSMCYYQSIEADICKHL